MSNITPLGSGARLGFPPPAADPAAIPVSQFTAAVPTTLPALVADASDPSQAGPAAAPTAATPSDAATAVPAEPQFDVTAFEAGFAQLKQAVLDARTTLTQDVASLKAEDEQLDAQIADWDARASAAEDRRKEIAAQLNTKLTAFSELDQATTHLEATEGLLYPQPAAQ